MRLYTFIALFLIGSKAQNEDQAATTRRNQSHYIPPNYVEVTQPPLDTLKALTRCGEGVEKGKKVCVPYYRCDPDTNTITPEEVTTGEGIFDIRENANECQHFLDVCCKIPNGDIIPTPSPTPPVGPPKPKFSHCGIRNPQGIDFKITGQTNEAEYGEFPWMVAILKTNYNPKVDETQFLCGASLIAPAVVLTSAHCVDKYRTSLSQIKIRAGEWDTLSEKERLRYQERAIKQIIIHEKFNPKSLVNNVALLVLDRFILQVDNVGTICLPPYNQIINSGECFATGWGKKEFGNRKRYSAILKKILLPTVPNPKCQNDLRRTRLGVNFVLDSSFICAGGKAQQDTCTGDGGSPLVCPDPNTPGRYVQAGIVSWGIGCGMENVPGVYVNVARFRDWVDQQMKVLGLNINTYTL